MNYYINLNKYYQSIIILNYISQCLNCLYFYNALASCRSTGSHFNICSKNSRNTNSFSASRFHFQNCRNIAVSLVTAVYKASAPDFETAALIFIK